jgi:hypothetical protein
MRWNEYVRLPKGNLEIIVQDFLSKEVLYYDDGSNQIQDWARHALSYLTAGIPFCSWGNHGDVIPEAGMSNLAIPHIADSTQNSSITVCPWQLTPNSALDYSGTWPANPTSQTTPITPIWSFVQYRNSQGVDQLQQSVIPASGVSVPLYPFFPTKMRFGTGGLDNNQLPLTNISTQATKLNSAQSTTTVFPFVIVDRTNTSAEDHIYVDSSGSIGTTTNNRVTFSCTLPGGSDSQGNGSPYNGYVISEAGLFCDAAVAPTINGAINYDMRTGLMFAYRTFYGIAKNASIDVTFRWSLVF